MEQEDIDWNDWFYYDETSPSCLRWKVGRGSRARLGGIAGTLNTEGYFKTKLDGKSYLVHRIIYEMFNGRLCGFQIDHINGNKSDNRLNNLRRVSHAENNRNKGKHSRNTSGVVGVYLFRQSHLFYWIACCRDMDGKYKTKSFPVLKHGHDEAFRLACEHRYKMIECLNALGAGYTNRHGT